MARSARRNLLPGYPLHVIQRGHNRDTCFRSDAGRILYLGLLEESSKRQGCAVHAFVLMTNHVHLVVSPPEIPPFSKMMKDLNQGFAQFVNRRNNRCGSVWQGRPRALMIDSESYLLTCQRYVEDNPVRAGMVQSPWLYPWSSYSTNAVGRKSSLVTPHPIYSRLGAT
ncbi:MAG TPA: transposase, partial [Usitatibacter sp.]|nr:transposase [Usitatibacter sp.]